MRILFAPIFQASAAASLAWCLANYLPQFGASLPASTDIGIAIVVIGGVILFVSVGAFFAQGTTVDPLRPDRAEQLVTTGLYRFSRNPMYLGMLIILIGFAVMLNNWLSFVAPVMFVCTMTFLQINGEEAALSQKFGVDYERYRQQTRRWI